MNLQTKFSIGIASIVTLSSFAIGGMTVFSQQAVLKREILQNHIQNAKRLARVSEESLHESNLVFFNYVKSLQGERGFQEAAFVDKENVARIHSNPDLMDKILPSPDGAKILHEEQDLIVREHINHRGQAVWDYGARIYFAGTDVGAARLIYSKNGIQQFLRESLVKDVQRIGLITLLVLFISMIGALLLSKAMVRPIQRVVEGMKEVANGRLTPISFPKRRDELGWMGEELNVTINKLKEVDEIKRDFVAGITHDLKSPLTAILGSTMCLLKGAGKLSAEEQRNYLVPIETDGKRLLRLIDNLLTTARIEARHVDLDFGLFDVRGPIEEVVQLYTPLADEKKIKLIKALPSKPVYVWADREKVVHVLTNLLSNAVKYTPEGSITVAVEDEVKDVRVDVKDTGMGIPASERAKIFQKFYRSWSNRKEAKGTGLGLYIVKGLVESLGGAISVRPNEEKGTVFSFTLSRENPED